MTGGRIKELRLEKAATQKELADYLGLTPKMISFYENGKRFPTQSNIKKIAQFFNVSADYLLGISDVKTISEVEELRRLKSQEEMNLSSLSSKKVALEKELRRVEFSLTKLDLRINQCKAEKQNIENDLSDIAQAEVLSIKNLKNIERKLGNAGSKISDKFDLVAGNREAIFKEIHDILKNYSFVLVDENERIVGKHKTDLIDIIMESDFETQLSFLAYLVNDIELNDTEDTLTVFLNGLQKGFAEERSKGTSSTNAKGY